jgi:hypothetical protein
VFTANDGELFKKHDVPVGIEAASTNSHALTVLPLASNVELPSPQTKALGNTSVMYPSLEYTSRDERPEWCWSLDLCSWELSPPLQSELASVSNPHPLATQLLIPPVVVHS